MIRIKKLLTICLSVMMFLSSSNFLHGYAVSNEDDPEEDMGEVVLVNAALEQKRQEVKHELDIMEQRLRDFHAQHQSNGLLIDDAAGPLGALEQLIQQVNSTDKLQLLQDYFEYFEEEYKLGFMTQNLEEKITELESKKADLTGERQQELEGKIAEARKILEVLKPMYAVLKGKGTEMINKVTVGDADGFEALKADFDEPKAKVQEHQNLSAQLSQQYTGLKNQEDKLNLIILYETKLTEKATTYKAEVDAIKKFLVKEERDEKKKEIDGARHSALLSLQKVVVGDKNTMQQNMDAIINEFEQSAQNSSQVQGYGPIKRELQDYIDTEVKKIQNDNDRQKIQRELLLKVDKLDSKDKVAELKQKVDKRVKDPKSGSWASKNEDIINNQAVKDATSGLASGLHDGFKPQDTKVNPQAPSVAPAKINQVKKQHRIHKVSVPNTGV